MPFTTPGKRYLARQQGAYDGGDLAYLFLYEARRFLRHRVEDARDLRYQDFANVLAAFESAKFVFQDQDMREYEATKRHENGDVEA